MLWKAKQPEIGHNRNLETNVATRTEVTGRIGNDIEAKIAMLSTGDVQDHARETETGGIETETMSVRGRGHETGGGDQEVETEDETTTTLAGERLTTLGRAVETEIVERGAEVDRAHRIFGGGVVMIDD